MNQPRINVRSKKNARQNWAGREQKPISQRSSRPPDRQQENIVDYWSPYLQKKRPNLKQYARKRRPFPPPLKKGATKAGTSNHSLLKLVVSVGSGVLVGTLMGLLILNVFVGGAGLPQGGSTIDTHLEESSQTTDSTTREPSGTEANASELPELNPVWVQGGVFSNQSGADEHAFERRENGQAAVVHQTDDQYRVFYGIGLTRDDALKIAGELKEAGEEVYLKDDLAVTAITIDDVSTEQAQMLQRLAEEGQRVVAMLGTLSAAGIAGNETESEWETMEQSHRTFVSSLTQLKEGLADEQQQILNTMDQALAQCMEAVKQHEQDRSVGYMWQVQEGLMQYVLAYQQLGQSF